MNGYDYELLLQKLVEKISNNAPLSNYEIGRGRKNRIAGISGYKHQIDLSLKGEDKLYLVEAKNWAKPVNLETVLILAARKADIEEAIKPVKVECSIVSTKCATKGAKLFAEHHKIGIDVVVNLEEYGLKFGNQVFQGIKEQITAQDSQVAGIVRSCSKCDKRFPVLDNESICPKCSV